MRATKLVAGALAALLAAPPAMAQQAPTPPAPVDAVPVPPPPPAAPGPQAAAPPPPPPGPPRRPFPPGEPASMIRLRDGDREIHVRCTPQESARECAEVALNLAEELGRGDRRRLGRDERGGSRRERRDWDEGYDEDYRE